MIYKEKRELVIIGGGAAGIAAAVKAAELGIKDILLIERDIEIGGILQQCIHNGFGVHIFKEELTGPEYVERWLEKLKQYNIEIRLNSMVMTLDNNKNLKVQSPSGIFEIQAKVVIGAMGCMELHRGAMALPGPRVSGIMTAGSAQRMLNIDGLLPGKKVVVLGSGDIGLIMSRRMTLEGAEVKGIYEIMPYTTGLLRNVVQCLEDFDIPLYFLKTVAEVHGKSRLEAVTIVDVDENRNPISGTEEYIECDTLLLSVGLRPVTKLFFTAGVQLNPSTKGPITNHLMQTSIPGIFACGNSLHVHDLVDNVSHEGEKAALGAYLYLQETEKMIHPEIEVHAGEGIIYTVPKSIRLDTDDKFYEILFRVNKPMIGSIQICSNDEILVTNKNKHLNPGEMEKVIIPRMKLSNFNDPVIIRISQ